VSSQGGPNGSGARGQTVDESNRATVQVGTRKSELARVEIWINSNNVDESFRVRVQKDDGGSPAVVKAGMAWEITGTGSGYDARVVWEDPDSDSTSTLAKDQGPDF